MPPPRVILSYQSHLPNLPPTRPSPHRTCQLPPGRRTNDPPQETIGNLSGSAPWQAAGQDDKAAAVEEMRAAKQTTVETQNPTVGKVEEMLGKGVGCEGMVEEGGRASGGS